MGASFSLREARHAESWERLLNIVTLQSALSKHRMGRHASHASSKLHDKKHAHLPLPLSPTRATVDPAGTSRVNPLNIWSSGRVG